MASANISSSSPAKSIKPRAPFVADAVIADRYRILRRLGEGSTGMVYEAEHVLLHKKVAVKILHPELTDMPDGVARFEREAMATARIEHDNVAAAIDFGRLPDGLIFLALEFVEGKSLREEVSKGPLGVPRALHIARQIASALAAAQKLEIVHRDLKPENVMLVLKGDDADFVKVLDFGVARVPVDESPIGGPSALTKAGAVFGTEEYMPPEQGIGQKVDTRADLYSLGIMLFEMVTGQRPYAKRDDLGILAQQLTMPIPTFAERVPGIVVPRPLERLVMRLLAKRPQERISRADDVVKAIDDITAGKAGESDAAELATKAQEPLPAFALTTKLDGLAPPTVDVKAATEPPPAAPGLGTADSFSAVARISERPRKAISDAASLLVRGIGHSFRKASDVVDARRKGLPEPLKSRLMHVPAGLLVCLVVGALLLALTGIGIWHRRAQTARASQAAAASASAAAVAKAAAASASAAQAAASAAAAAVRPASSEGDSKDPDFLLDLAQAKLREGKELEAVNSVSHVLGRHPDRRNDPRVANILFKTAGSTTKGVAFTTFSLLEGAMAAPGAEIVYQLAIDKSVPGYVRTRAEKWLHSVQFDRAASDALRVAAKIRFIPNCEGKHAILPMAAKVGGKAALAYLHELENQNGCGLSGKNDCYACLRNDNQLKDAIEQIETRLK